MLLVIIVIIESYDVRTLFLKCFLFFEDIWEIENL